MLTFIKEKKLPLLLVVMGLTLLVAAFGLAVGSALIFGVGMALTIPAVVSAM